MKVDRRSFLSFVIGGAAGTALSPLPWKLMDDSSIWSQMWPWTPVPPDGEVVYEDSTCTLCPGGCGISVRKVDSRAVKIEGQSGHPVNDGSICILGLSGLQMLYGPTRIKSPMKRIGERGEGKWQKISWDEAIAILTEKLTDIRDKGEAHTVAALAGSDSGTVPALIQRFMAAYGSPNFMRSPSYRDVDELTVKALFGADGRTGFDVENADYVLSFGSGFVDGWGSPVRMFKAASLWKEKDIPVVQVEPRLSNDWLDATRDAITDLDEILARAGNAPSAGALVESLRAVVGNAEAQMRASEEVFSQLATLGDESQRLSGAMAEMTRLEERLKTIVETCGILVRRIQPDEEQDTAWRRQSDGE